MTTSILPLEGLPTPVAGVGVRSPFISIVMPCLNERETVAACVLKAKGWLDRSGFAGEVLVIDNGSTDGSADLAVQAGAQVISESRRGYGAALRRGFAEAKGDWIVMGDCDDTYDFSRLSTLVGPLADGYDLVVGNRHAGGIAPGAMTWSHRYIGTPAISLMLKLFTGLKVGDSQCGLRAITREALAKLELQTVGMELASEMVLKAARRDLRVIDVPIPYGERLGEAKLNTMRDGWRHLRYLLLSTPNYLFTIPGLVLTILGILTLALASRQKGIELGDQTWEPVFAGGIFLIVGVNAILLGLASRIYTTARGITKEDALLRFYRRYLGLEVMIAIGLLLIAAGIGLDIILIFVGSDGPDRIYLAAMAQASIAVGANIGLVGFLSSLLDQT